MGPEWQALKVEMVEIAKSATTLIRRVLRIERMDFWIFIYKNVLYNTTLTAASASPASPAAVEASTPMEAAAVEAPMRSPMAKGMPIEMVSAGIASAPPDKDIVVRPVISVIRSGVGSGITVVVVGA
jgi:hypothetical protein